MQEREEETPSADEDPVFGKVIHSYSRAEALEDGMLVNLTSWAKEVGFKVAVACTAAVWSEVITPPEESRKLFGQSERGRAHDVLFVLLCRIRAAKAANQVGTDTLFFEVIVDDRPTGKRRKVRFKSVMGPGDDLEPVMTLMYPEES